MILLGNCQKAKYFKAQQVSLTKRSMSAGILPVPPLDT